MLKYSFYFNLFLLKIQCKNLMPLEDYEEEYKKWMIEYSIKINEEEYFIRLQNYANTHDLIYLHNLGFIFI